MLFGLAMNLSITRPALRLTAVGWLRRGRHTTNRCRPGIPPVATNEENCALGFSPARQLAKT